MRLTGSANSIDPSFDTGTDSLYRAVLTSNDIFYMDNNI